MPINNGSNNNHLINTVNEYLLTHPDERERLSHLIEQISKNENLNDRKNFGGHVTSSVLLLSKRGTDIFLIKNKALDLWLLPGGHVEGDETPMAGAEREVHEETGYNNLTIINAVPIDIDTHPIPYHQGKNEPEHVHHDFRFIAQLQSTNAAILQTEEIADGCWKPIDTLSISELPPSLHRALRKLKNWRQENEQD